MAYDPQVNQVLVAILEMVKQQAIYSHRLHGWVIAVSETIEKQPNLVEQLRAHPFFDQGPRPDLQTTQYTIQNIDALIHQLKG
jgi:hypothetical protein